MRSLFTIFFVLTTTLHSAQNTVTCPGNKQVDLLIDKAIAANRNGESQKGIQILQNAIELSKKSNCRESELMAQKSMMLSYAQVYQYKKALSVSKTVEEIALDLKDYKILSSVFSTRAVLFTNLGLYKESISAYNKALEFAQQINNDDTRNFELGFIHSNLATYYQDSSLEKAITYLQKSKTEMEKVSNHGKDIPLSKKMDMLVSINTNLGMFYQVSNNPKRNLEKSKYYYDAALRDAENQDYQVGFESKINLYECLLEFYNAQKDYNKAIEFGEKMLVTEKSYSMPYNRRVGYMVLAKAYLGAGKNETSKKYLDLYSKINDSITTVEKEAVEEPVKQIIKKNENNYSEKVKTTFVMAGIIILLILAGAFALWYFHKKKLKKSYEAIITNLKTNQIAITEKPTEIQKVEDENPASINIADDTLKTLLKRLEKFESSNRFTKQDVNFAYLSNYLGTNSKYLNNILKEYKDKTFSQYINDLRINYIIKQLYEKPKYREYKTSYLAEECGFSSREVFTTTFKKITGIPPSYFIENLKKEEQTSRHLETTN